MSSVHRCPADRADIPAGSRPVTPRKRRRRRRSPACSLLPALLLFGGGFLLGRAQGPPAANVAKPSASAEPLGTQTAPAEETAEAWYLILVNGEHPLPEDFPAPELTELRNGQSIDSRVYPALQEMMDAARAAGYHPLISSSYRTEEKQTQLFQKKVRSYLEQGLSQGEAEEQASFWVARPGTSEHQAGLAVDIVDLEYQLLDEKQESTAVQRWLMAHCAEYGFILRYPTEKSGVTGVGYEPWHYRYVGVDAARAITDRGLCLEEYLDGAE